MEIFKVLALLSLILCSSSAIDPLQLEEVDIDSRAANASYRLPVSVTPLSYDITITPFFTNFTFDGHAKIQFKVDKPNITVITLHAHGLNVLSITPSIIGIIKNYTFIEEYDFLVIDLNFSLGTGVDFFIDFYYNGYIRDDMSGFYRSSYVENGTTEWLATTQFQPVHARKAFPCFDEPSYKAEFSITFKCPDTYTCRSNMPAIGNETGLVKFEKSPKMSSYLVAFIVSKFVPAKQSLENGTLKILARPEAKTTGDYAFTTARKLQEYMDSYFDLKYYDMSRNMKMDHAAIPDFQAGAMENWGLITYREAYLMYDPLETSTRSKNRIAGIVSHELTHMWFGDYMTCHWWSDTWLNEGFARFFQYFATEEVTSNLDGFGCKDQFIVEQVHTALSVDTALSSSPMTNPNINSPAEISNHFGTITYNKGASIIRMIQHWIGDTEFRNGLRALLKSKKFASVYPDDLFAALQNNSNIASYNSTVKEVMESWTSKSGYPLLIVNVDRENNTVQLQQRRFVKRGESGNSLYSIPITYTTQNSTDFSNTKPIFIMKTSSGVIRNMDVPSWIIFNIQQTGFYRVKYDTETTKLLTAELSGSNRNQIHSYNRAQIVDDAFALAREGEIKFSEMLDIVQFLESETDYTPWIAAISGFNNMRLHFRKIESISDRLDEHISNLMKILIDSVGLTDKGKGLERMLRANVLSLACELGHKGCIDNSIQHYEQFMNGSIPRIPADLRVHVYCNAIREGSYEKFNHLLEKHTTSNVASEKVVILGALGCTKDPVLIKRYLSMALDPHSEIRDHDRMNVFNYVLDGNPKNAEVVLDYVFDNFKNITEMFSNSGLRSIISSLSTRLSKTKLNEMKTLIEQKLDGEDKTSGLKSIENAQKMIQWIENQVDDVDTWLYQKYNSAASLSASLVLLITMLISLFFNNSNI